MEMREGRLPSVFVIPLMQCIAGAVLFMALLYRQRDLVLLALLVLGVMGVSKVWSRASSSRIGCHATVDRERLFPGESLVLQIEVENAKFLPVWLRVTAVVNDSMMPSSGDETLTGESGLLWYQRAHFRWDLVARRRGIHRVGTSRVRVSDLFGFFPHESGGGKDLHVIVYPRLVPLRPVTVLRRDFFGLPGDRHPVEDPIYILGVRDYQNWRPARYIHWKASARHHRLQEKAFESSEQAKVLLVVDVKRFVIKKAREDFEEVLEVIASLAVQFDQRGYAVGFATNGVVEGGVTMLHAGRNPQQLSTLLEALARLQMDMEEDLIHTLRHRLRPAWGMSCVHFSYEEDRDLCDAEEYYARRKIPVMFVVCNDSPQEQTEGCTVRGRVVPLEGIRTGGS